MTLARRDWLHRVVRLQSSLLGEQAVHQSWTVLCKNAVETQAWAQPWHSVPAAAAGEAALLSFCVKMRFCSFYRKLQCWPCIVSCPLSFWTGERVRPVSEQAFFLAADGSGCKLTSLTWKDLAMGCRNCHSRSLPELRSNCYFWRLDITDSVV